MTTPFVLLNILLSGIVIPATVTHSGISWLQYLSISYYTSTALAHLELSGLPFRAQVLEGYARLTELSVWGALGALLGWIVFYIVLGMISLYLTCRRDQLIAK